MSGLTLDAGALIAIDRGDRRTTLLVDLTMGAGRAVAIPAGALAQAWRDGARQARLARLVAAPGVDIVALDGTRARAAGQLCGLRATSDVVDASVVLCARSRSHAVVTSDSKDLLRLDPTLPVARV